MKRLFLITAILTAPAVTSAGELIITETNDHNSSVSLKVNNNNLTINDAVVWIAEVVGTDEEGQPVTVGPVAQSKRSDGIGALVKYEGHYYSYPLKEGGDAFSSAPEGSVFSDSNCNNFIGVVGLGRNLMVKNPLEDQLYAISTDSPTPFDPSTVYGGSHSWEGYNCREFSLEAADNPDVNPTYFFSAEALDITEADLLNNAAPPYRVVYR